MINILSKHELLEIAQALKRDHTWPVETFRIISIPNSEGETLYYRTVIDFVSKEQQQKIDILSRNELDVAGIKKQLQKLFIKTIVN